MEANTLNKQDFLRGGGEMGQQIRSVNWTATTIGLPDKWPQSLKTAMSIMLQTPVPMFIAWGPAFTFFCNDAYRSLFPDQHSNIIGRNASEIFAREWNNLEPVFNDVLHGNAVTVSDVPVTTERTGYSEITYYSFSYTSLYSESGKGNGVYATATKNTEKSESYFRRLADTIPVMLYMTRPDGYCTYVNQKWYDYTGLLPEQTIGQGWLSVVHPDDMPQMVAGFNEANASHTPFYLEYRIKGADDKYRWILDSGSPMFDDNGVFEGYIGSVIDIDKRKLAEDAVRESEKRFRQLADSMPQIVWTANPDGYTDYYNKQWYLFIGEEGQFGDSSFLYHIHPDDQQRCYETWYRSVNSGEPYEIEYRFKVKYPDEAYRWFLVRALPIKNDNGQIIKWYGTCTDIDDAKRIQQSLRESEERFRIVADSAPVMVWMSDTNKKFAFFNKGWLEFTGRTLQQELGDGWQDGILQDDLPQPLIAYHEAFDARRDFEIEFRLRRHDGQYRWIVSHGIPRYSWDGHFLGYIGSCIDINERKTIRLELEKRVAERTINLEMRNEELRQSEERYLRMTNEVEDYAIILLSKEGYIENWNKGAEKIKGYTIDEIIGKHFRLFYTTADQNLQVPEKLIEEATLKGKSTYEGWRLRKDGSSFWGYTVITALHNDKNDVIGFSKVTRDLTERKMAEDQLKVYAEQLEQKNRELERSNSELTSFSYVASHDLQEPLRKIQAFGNLIQARDAENMSPVSKDYFDRMVKAAIRMQNLIDSLLEFSRTTTSRKSLEVTDLNLLFEEVKKELAHRIEEKKASIISAHLPMLPVIPFQFKQLLSNLVNNSLKYARTNVHPVIEIKASYLRANEMKEKANIAGKDYYKFSVTDNGIGFEQEYAERIFDLFQRLHGRNEYSGSGIGLAICKKIVENHNGFMRAESEPDAGATFYFYIPAR